MTNIYHKDLTRDHKPLTRAEQADLYQKIQNGDIDSKNTVIHSCLPLVIDIAKKFRYNNKHIDLDPITIKDEAAFKIGLKMGIKNYSLSFTNKAKDVHLVRKIIGDNTNLISKIESIEGVLMVLPSKIFTHSI